MAIVKGPLVKINITLLDNASASGTTPRAVPGDGSKVAAKGRGRGCPAWL